MDKSSIEKAIKHFEFQARPSSACSSDPVTVRDIQNLIHEVSKLARAISDSSD